MAVTTYYGLSIGEWQVLGILGGLVIGVLGWLTGVVFQYLNYRRGQR